MYTFPQIHLPAKAIEEAVHHKTTPDGYYCLRVLEETGVVSYKRTFVWDEIENHCDLVNV